jgi:hypothetical protein
MTTTKALAKLYKAIVGSDGRNSAAKIISDLADNWSTATGSANAAKIPALPATGATATYVLKATKDGDNYTYSWVAES